MIWQTLSFSLQLFRKVKLILVVFVLFQIFLLYTFFSLKQFVSYIIVNLRRIFFTSFLNSARAAILLACLGWTTGPPASVTGSWWMWVTSALSVSQYSASKSISVLNHLIGMGFFWGGGLIDCGFLQ
jgi:hypothetical protein